MTSSPCSWPRRRLCTSVAAATLLAVAPPGWAEASWKPSGPVRIIVPYPAGGATDVIARMVQAPLSERLGQQVVIDNKPGATGSIGAQQAYLAPKDGSVLMVGVADTVVVFPHLAKLAFDPLKFEPVGGLALLPMLLVGRSDLPADNLQELVALAKKKSLSYANGGNGSIPHLMAVAFGQALGLQEQLHVPYAGFAPTMLAMHSKQVDVMMVPTGNAGIFQYGFKVYGVATEARVPSLPNVPTLTEQGLPIVGGAWLALFAPPNTPGEITSALAKVLAEVTAAPQYQARLRELNTLQMTQTPAELRKFITADDKRWAGVVRAGNIKMD